VQALSRGLAARGHSVDIIHCVDSYRALAAAVPSAPELEPAGITRHALRSPFGILSPMATQQTGQPLLKSAQILRILASKSFDVILFHNVSLVGGPGVLGLGRAIKLYTLHEHWLLCPMHTLFRDQSEVCTGKRCVSCSLRYKRPPQWWRYTGLMDRNLAHVDRFLAPTEFTREIHVKSGLPMRDVRLLESFYQPGEQQEEGVPAQKFFLFAGRLEKLRGVSDLIEAIRPYRDAGLVIAGEGAELARLQDMARGCDHIRFLGRIGQERQTEPGLREELGAAGRKTWRERWTLDAHLSEYMDMIGELR
jgi:glycosyltransferase involved in cell wall biosynthesis